MRFHCFLIGFVGLLIGFGCDSRPKGNFRSSRRVVAAEFRTPSADVLRYITSTNEVQLFEGSLGNFAGTVTVVVPSSDANGWRMQFISAGRISSGGEVRGTQWLDLPYPRKQSVFVPELGKVTVWFLSDEELERDAAMFGK